MSQPQLQRVERADRFFDATGATIRHGGSQAYYCQGTDHVQMPPFECFRDAESYCSTLAHELTHWTKHPERLNRDFGRKRGATRATRLGAGLRTRGRVPLRRPGDYALIPRLTMPATSATGCQVLKGDRTRHLHRGIERRRP